MAFETIKEMCDHGAKLVKAGLCPGLKFNIFPQEEREVIEYMTVNHPEIDYVLSIPVMEEQ